MLTDSLRQSLADAVTTYHLSVDEAAGYLAARGITKETAAKFHIGYVTDANAAVGHDMYVGRLSIPYMAPTGVTDVRFRAISDEQTPKYLGRAGAELTLYNVLAFRDSGDTIAICEGEIDTITATMCGIPAVGLAGVNAWRDYYYRAFLDYPKVLVLCDGDQPGRELGKKIASAVEQAVVINMPDGMDVNSVFLMEGADGVRRRCGQ